MRVHRIVALASAAVVFVESLPRAQACHESTGNEFAWRLAAGAGAIDLPLTIHDLAVHRSSRGFAVAELGLSGVMLGYTFYGFIATHECEGSSYALLDGTDSPMGGVALTWNAVLVLHAVAVLTRRRAAPTSTAPRGRAIAPRTLMLTPAVVDGAHTPALALGVAGTF